MIDLSNLGEYLKARGYSQNNGLYEKTYEGTNTRLVVNTDEQTILYPVIVHDKTTSNFEENENFVVLDCVDRLLEIGYPPECIEIEPRWTLGHTSKGGKADVCVRDRAGDMYLIVECKTAGEEFNRYSAQLAKDGGQLFSYWQQETKTRWLCLYTADVKSEQAEYEGVVIDGSGDNAKQYAQAGSAVERHEVWLKLGSPTMTAESIFSHQAEPYRIAEKPFTKRQLRDFTPSDKGKFIRNFEEILRHNSISDKENAFNKLVVLLICKLVDELDKPDDEILDFQIKLSDTYELVQDRLQLLYKQGMDRFLNEDIYYLELDYPTRLVSQYKGDSRQNLIHDLQDTIRKLKFFTNSDFAFKDVHNDRLFRENGAILFEMVRLIQPYRIVYPTRHQVLGDLFESLLNSGFKQDEGQYFTPMPITRFVWDCIPTNLLMPSGEYPKFIDFAAGAGHFLNEGVLILNELHEKQADNSWTVDKVYGIEKDDRLARVSKVSMLMNGISQSNIINGDGLACYPEVPEGTFDLVVSNPPYSVASFKKYLPTAIQRRLSLSDSITDTGNQIESLFVERANELLKSGGTCVLVLPTALLSNEDATSVATRKFILQHFRIRAIVNMGTKTFQATDTPTSIIFMNKRVEPPQQWKTVWDSAEAAFSVHSNPNWDGRNELLDYAECMEYDLEQLHQVIAATGKWWECDNLIDPSEVPSDISTSNRKQDNLHRRIIERERESFYYWMLARNTYIAYVQSPSASKEQENFLGYRWSSGRSMRGLTSLERDSVLDGYTQRAPQGSVADFVRQAFEEDFGIHQPTLPKYSKRALLTDCIDFTTNTFIIDGADRIVVHWNCPTRRLGSLCPDMIIGKTPPKKSPKLYEGDQQWVAIADISDAVNDDKVFVGPTKTTIRADAIQDKKALAKGTLIMSFKLSIGLCAFTSAERTFTNEAIVALMPETELDKKYLYCLFSSGAVPLIPKGTKKIGKAFNSGSLNNITVPYPSEENRRKIVQSCLTGYEWKSSVKDRHNEGVKIMSFLAGEEEASRIQNLLAKVK